MCRLEDSICHRYLRQSLEMNTSLASGSYRLPVSASRHHATLDRIRKASIENESSQEPQSSMPRDRFRYRVSAEEVSYSLRERVRGSLRGRPECGPAEA